MKSIRVEAERTYEVIFAKANRSSLAAALSVATRIALIVPEDLKHFADALASELTHDEKLEKVVVIAVGEGESQKSLATVSRCWNVLGEENFRRNDLVIGIGGGATTDLAGFVAATWLRGIDWIAIPTSLAGMVDAAIGGKTGINSEAGKNLVGSFHSPSAVIIDTNYLKSLPMGELRAGFAEVIKTGFIADQRILEIIEERDDFLDVESASLKELIERSVAVKADVVSKDLKESFLREALNYGHTLAHAIEKHENYRWRHGDAVAVGLAYIANLAYVHGTLSVQLLDRHLRILEKVGLPITYRRDAWPSLFGAMQSDKKARAGGLRFVAITDDYEVIRLEGLSPDMLQAAYERIST